MKMLETIKNIMVFIGLEMKVLGKESLTKEQ